MARARALTAALAAALGLAACSGDGPLSGGGSGVENPSIALAFLDHDGPVEIRGNLTIYEEESDWEDTSLFVRTLDGQDTAILTAHDLANALAERMGDSLLPETSLGFNIVVSGNGKEGLFRGFRIRGNRARGYTFERFLSGPNTRLSAELHLAPPVLLHAGNIAAEDMDKNIKVVFVPGAPYFALVDKQGFMAFPILPPGTFTVRALAFAPPGLPPPTLYCSPDSLRTNRPFTLGRWQPCPEQDFPL